MLYAVGLLRHGAYRLARVTGFRARLGGKAVVLLISKNCLMLSVLPVTDNLKSLNFPLYSYVFFETFAKKKNVVKNTSLLLRFDLEKNYSVSE